MKLEPFLAKWRVGSGHCLNSLSTVLSFAASEAAGEAAGGQKSWCHCTLQTWGGGNIFASILLGSVAGLRITWT